MNNIRALIEVMRLPFLILTPTCIAVGVGTAYQQTGQFDFPLIALVLLGALSAHASVNVFNEYFDCQSGLDRKTDRTPYSGGTGALPANPAVLKSAYVLAWATLGVTAAIGLYFVWLKGWQLLPLGLLGLFIVVTYTTWWLYRPALSLFAPGLGFGIAMVMGTHFVLTAAYTWPSFVAALAPTFLISEFTMINHFPDAEADRSIGRRNLPVTIGLRASSRVYGVCLALAYLSVTAGVLLGFLPWTCLIVLLSAVPAWRIYEDIHRNADDTAALVPHIGKNVIHAEVTVLLLAVGLLIG